MDTRTDPLASADGHHHLIKMAADTLDLIILRTLVDSAMTRRVTVNPGYMDKLALARDILIDLHTEIITP